MLPRLVSRRAAGDTGEPVDYRTAITWLHAGRARRGVGPERDGLQPGNDGCLLPPCDHSGAGMLDEQRYCTNGYCKGP